MPERGQAAPSPHGKKTAVTKEIIAHLTAMETKLAAVTGLLFFGALGHGYGPAFGHSVLQMGALLLVVAALTRLMRARTSRAR